MNRLTIHCFQRWAKTRVGDDPPAHRFHVDAAGHVKFALDGRNEVPLEAADTRLVGCVNAALTSHQFPNPDGELVIRFSHLLAAGASQNRQ